MSAPAVAQEGISAAMGLKNIAIMKRTPTTKAVRPVLPPSATPAEDSTKVVTVEVPQMAPVQVAMESQRRAFWMFLTSPVSSSRPLSLPADWQVPISVPMVSNISTIAKAMSVAIKSKILLVGIFFQPSVNALPNACVPKSWNAWIGLEKVISSNTALQAAEPAA